MNLNHPNRACRTQLEMIRALDFALQETVLYLDAYPQSKEALQYYHTLLEQREKAVADYQKEIGPLTIYGNKSTRTWDWVNGPWPWEADAN